VYDSHIPKLAAAMRGNTSVTSIFLRHVGFINCFDVDHEIYLTEDGLEQLLELVRTNTSITQIDIDDVEIFLRDGYIDEDMWAAIGDACQVT
jgi:hypothetical protein